MEKKTVTAPMTSPQTLRPGVRLWSAVDTTSVVVVRPPATPVVLTCGDAPMTEQEQPGRADPPAAGAGGGAEPGTLLGKRYTDPQTGLEVLCTHAGAGVLAADGRPLAVVGARTLPASD